MRSRKLKSETNKLISPIFKTNLTTINQRIIHHEEQKYRGYLTSIKPHAIYNFTSPIKPLLCRIRHTIQTRECFTINEKSMKRMKTHTLYFTILAIVASIFSVNKVSAQVYGDVSFDLFYDELSPYGYWDRDVNYGDIWFPDVDRNFRPYGTNGYWTMTEYGNTWVSNYDWGWAPFHYGRWVYTNYNGWGWIPGYEWGPAWVDWRTGGGYYGWAPMAPAVGISISAALPINLWVFLPVRRIYDPYISRHWSYGQRNIYNRTTIINNTYIVNNHHYYGGPGRRDIERNLGRRVSVRSVRTTSNPGRSRVDNRSVSIYKPDRNSTRSSASRSNAGQNSRSTNEARRTDRSTGSNNTRNNTIQNRNTDSRSGSRNSTTTRSDRSENNRNVGRTNTATERSTTTNRINRSESKNEAPTRQERSTPQNQSRSSSRNEQSSGVSRSTTQQQRSNSSNGRTSTEQRATPNRSESRSRNQGGQSTASSRVYQTSQRTNSTASPSSRQSSSSTSRSSTATRSNTTRENSSKAASERSSSRSNR